MIEPPTPTKQPDSLPVELATAITELISSKCSNNWQAQTALEIAIPMVKTLGLPQF
jgi:hypothetical protein